MAYPKVLNEQYKAEKAAGTTTAKSFPEWNELRLAAIKLPIAPELSIIPENIDQIKLPTIDETLAIAFAALEVVEKAKVVVEAKIIKSKIAEVIFVEAVNAGPLVRKEVVAKFMKAISEGGAGLSIKGANTYFHNLKAKYGLVVAKTAV